MEKTFQSTSPVCSSNFRWCNRTISPRRPKARALPATEADLREKPPNSSNNKTTNCGSRPTSIPKWSNLKRCWRTHSSLKAPKPSKPPNSSDWRIARAARIWCGRGWVSARTRIPSAKKGQSCKEAMKYRRKEATMSRLSRRSWRDWDSWVAVSTRRWSRGRLAAETIPWVRQ